MNSLNLKPPTPDYQLEVCILVAASWRVNLLTCLQIFSVRHLISKSCRLSWTLPNGTSLSTLHRSIRRQGNIMNVLMHIIWHGPWKIRCPMFQGMYLLISRFFTNAKHSSITNAFCFLKCWPQQKHWIGILTKL